MILPFSTMLNGKPTYFVERIQKALSTEEPPAPLFNYRPTEFNTLAFLKVAPKLHTIRVDEKDRWHEGMDIHFFIYNRQPNMFMFAPITKVVSVQEIFMTYYQGRFEVSVDDRQLMSNEIVSLSENDGFEKRKNFELYFISQMKEGVFKGKIIHWTGKRY